MNITQSKVQCRVYYFSVLSQITRKREEEISIKAGSDLQDLLQLLEQRYPEVKTYTPYIRIAVNQSYTTLDYTPAENDEIALITPVSGG